MNTTHKKLSINQWAEEDRPREKMIAKGIDVLSDAELLGILIGSGNTEESAVELMRRMLLACDNNLNELGKWTLPDFSGFKGIGPAKATTLMAALELGKRRKMQEVKERVQITCSKDIYEMFHPVLCDLPQEEFWILLTNQSNKVIEKLRISTGGIDGTYADVRSILREAILHRATGVVLIHNHPSGNPAPSVGDKKVTSAIRQGAQTMNIRLTDHVIICDGTYYSFADEGNIV
ncbi:MAG: DNA repair protein RadC [Mediterranea sp.]|jgi:DNA repair protein RadC|nr:DNA repair protein RadC [Mediterranea sp.]